MLQIIKDGVVINDKEGTSMTQKFKNNKGFTVIELLLTICMIGIIAIIAGPNLRNQLSNLKLKSVARDIYSSFQEAKLEAVKENENVAILFSKAAYSPEGNDMVYQMFRDDGAGGGTAGNAEKDGGESTLKSISMPKGVSLITATFSNGIDTKEGVGFNAQGLPDNSYHGIVEVRTSARWYRINLSVAGNVYMQKSDDGINWS